MPVHSVTETESSHFDFTPDVWWTFGLIFTPENRSPASLGTEWSLHLPAEALEDGEEVGETHLYWLDP